MTQWRGEPRGDTGKDVPGTEATHAKPGSGSDLGFKEEQKAEGARGEVAGDEVREVSMGQIKKCL